MVFRENKSGVNNYIKYKKQGKVMEGVFDDQEKEKTEDKVGVA